MSEVAEKDPGPIMVDCKVYRKRHNCPAATGGSGRVERFVRLPVMGLVVSSQDELQYGPPVMVPIVGMGVFDEHGRIPWTGHHVRIPSIY